MDKKKLSGETFVVTGTPDEALNQQEMRVMRPIDEAAQFLFYFLGSGPKLVKEVFRRAENEGHSKTTIRRAQKRLGIKSRKVESVMAGSGNCQREKAKATNPYTVDQNGSLS